MKWGISHGTIMVGDERITGHRADVDLCYCYTCKTFSYYDWHMQMYFDLSDEYMQELEPEMYEKWKNRSYTTIGVA